MKERPVKDLIRNYDKISPLTGIRINDTTHSNRAKFSISLIKRIIKGSFKRYSFLDGAMGLCTHVSSVTNPKGDRGIMYVSDHVKDSLPFLITRLLITNKDSLPSDKKLAEQIIKHVFENLKYHKGNLIDKSRLVENVCKYTTFNKNNKDLLITDFPLETLKLSFFNRTVLRAIVDIIKKGESLVENRMIYKAVMLGSKNAFSYPEYIKNYSRKELSDISRSLYKASGNYDLAGVIILLLEAPDCSNESVCDRIFTHNLRDIFLGTNRHCIKIDIIKKLGAQNEKKNKD